MEYLQLGDLEGHLTARLSHLESRQIAEQLLEGLGFMQYVQNFLLILHTL